MITIRSGRESTLIRLYNVSKIFAEIDLKMISHQENFLGILLLKIRKMRLI